MFKRLYFRLALQLVAVFIVVGTLLLWLVSSAMERYSQAVTQRMNQSVAMYVSDEFQLIANGIANADALKSLAHHAMIINPSIEVYLIDKTGRILSYAVPSQQVVNGQIDMKPVKTFLNQTASFPIVGDDPSSLGERKVFSAHEVRFEGKVEGYVYIVLQSRKRDLLEYSLINSQIFQISALALVSCLAFGVLSALIIFYRFTRRLRKLAKKANSFYSKDQNPSSNLLAGDELDQLELAVESMQQRIGVQVEQIQQSDEMRRELIANISHDLRTPLTNMLGYIETLLLKQQTLKPEEKQHYLKITRNHGVRLGRLIADLFELAKFDSNAVKPHMEEFSIAELIHDVIQDFSGAASKKRIELSVTGDLDDSRVTADIRLMERVIENLLDNALRHTPTGGGVQIAIKRGNNGVTITVSDTGEGIAPADLPFIFDRYFHVRSYKNEALKSTGLGLAIVKRILELHYSSIEVQSHISQGTTFEFTLIQ